MGFLITLRMTSRLSRCAEVTASAAAAVEAGRLATASSDMRAEHHATPAEGRRAT